MNSMHDPALDSISAGINQGNASAVNAVGRELVDLVRATVMSRDGNAAFLTACAQHCGQWSQGPVPPPFFQDFNVSVDATNAIDAVGQWLGGGPRNFWQQEAAFPCADCCSGGHGVGARPL